MIGSDRIERDEISFQIGGYPMVSLGYENYKITDGNEKIWAKAPKGTSKERVLEVATKQFGEGLSVE